MYQYDPLCLLTCKPCCACKTSMTYLYGHTLVPVRHALLYLFLCNALLCLYSVQYTCVTLHIPYLCSHYTIPVHRLCWFVPVCTVYCTVQCPCAPVRTPVQTVTCLADRTTVPTLYTVPICLHALLCLYACCTHMPACPAVPICLHALLCLYACMPCCAYMPACPAVPVCLHALLCLYACWPAVFASHACNKFCLLSNTFKFMFL